MSQIDKLSIILVSSFVGGRGFDHTLIHHFILQMDTKESNRGAE
jgi:hypothetical protein